MKTLTTFALLLVATSTAHAEQQLAGDPDPSPRFPSVPQPLVVAAPIPRERPPLADRWTLTPTTGVLWLQVHGVTGTGMVLHPMVTRTFDRLELQADYLLANLGDDVPAMPGTTVHRLGGSVHYQAARVRVDRTMTLDLVTQAGVGLQHVVRDRARTIDRPDLSLGIKLRMLTDVGERGRQRVFFGAELGVRLLVTPRPGRGSDLGFVVAFGVPLGR